MRIQRDGRLNSHPGQLQAWFDPNIQVDAAAVTCIVSTPESRGFAIGPKQQGFVIATPMPYATC